MPGGRWAAALAAGAGALLAAGCAAGGAACPDIALASGFRVVVDEDSVPRSGLESVTVRVCQDGECHKARVELAPGTRAVDQGCAGSGPDSACSATAEPDGTLTGFWETRDFSPGPLDVAVSGAGFGPYRAALMGREAVSGSGACLQRAFQTSLRISDGKVAAD